MEEKERMEGQISKHSRICSSDMRLINYPITQEQKVFIWDKELCNGAEWNDFLKCVEEKSKENAELKKQLAITEKALELAVDYMQSYCPYLATKKKDGNVIFYIDKTDCDNNCSNCIKNYFKQRAKEMGNGER